MNLQRLAVSLTIAFTLAAAAAPPALAPNPAPSAVPATAAVSAPAAVPAPAGDGYDPTLSAPAHNMPRPAANPAPKADAPTIMLPGVPVSPAVVPVIPLPAASTSPLKYVPAPLTSTPRSFLWEVKSPGNTIYLFGTMHVGKREFYPLPDAVETAFDRSAKLVVEADVSEPMAGDVKLLISYFPPDSLDKNIPPAIYDRLKTQLARMHIPEAAVKPMKPFVVGGFLSVAEFSRLGYEMNLGVDAYLLARARDARKPVEELESVRSQLEMMSTMPGKLQEAFLDNAIATLELNRSANQVTGMVDAWRTGDAKLMAEVTEEVNRGMQLMPQLDEILLYGRHDAMLKKIESYLAGKETCFVAVGSLHLVGPRGLIQVLQSKGYEVKQK